VSADSIVPDVADGKGGSAATLGYDERVKLTPLTVDFHEPNFATTAHDENAFTRERGFWFQLNDDDRQEAKWQWGPVNPQALNRYAYVLNNPLRYIDPTGHCPGCAALAWAFASFGITISAPVIAAILGAVALGVAIGCVLNDTCRAGLVRLIRHGISSIRHRLTINCHNNKRYAVDY
jgi:hypothetical protein